MTRPGDNAASATGGEDNPRSRNESVDWASVKRVLSEAVDLPPGERGAILSTRLGHDPASNRRVRSLLEAHDRTDGFLVEPKPSESSDKQLPSRIGPYRPVERLGEGGFGVVYRATQVSPVAREVAVKVLRPGLDTPEVLARFRNERQYLASLDHGDVVKVFDAGVTEDGVAYIVMEYVHGKPVTEFAARLAVPDRLRLLARICRAVHAIHQRGVIHRDLKPSNILVNSESGLAEARFRIIDFGIASIAERSDRRALTMVGAPLGTPRYASPEQACGEDDIDTRTDIFALGMILCEVLTGGLPRTPRTAGEAAARPPSVLLPSASGILRGDLDRIVLKAVAWERDQRYESAAALAEDLERFLRGEPVRATRPTLAYTVTKFVARRRVVSSASAVALIALAVGVVGLVEGADRARRAEQEVRAALSVATEQRDRFDAINSFLLVDVIDSMNPNVTGTPLPTATELLDRMSELGTASFTHDPETAVVLLRRLAEAQHSLALYGPAADTWGRAYLAAEKTYGSHDERTLDIRLDGLLARLSARRFEVADQEIQDILALCEAHLGTDHAVSLRARVHAFHIVPGQVQNEDPMSVIEDIERVGLSGSAVHAEALEHLGALLGLSGDPRGISLLSEAAKIARQSSVPGGSDALNLSIRVGTAFSDAGRYTEALDVLRIAREEAERIHGVNSHVYKTVLNRLSVAAVLGGEADVGLRFAEELYRVSTSEVQEDDHFASIGAMLVARGFEETGEYARAIPWRRERLARFIEVTPNVEEHHSSRCRLVMTLVRAGAIEEAENEFDVLQAADGPYDEFRSSAALVLARALDEVGRSPDAAAMLRAERDANKCGPETVASLNRWIRYFERKNR